MSYEILLKKHLENKSLLTGKYIIVTFFTDDFNSSNELSSSSEIKFKNLSHFTFLSEKRQCLLFYRNSPNMLCVLMLIYMLLQIPFVINTTDDILLYCLTENTLYGTAFQNSLTLKGHTKTNITFFDYEELQPQLEHHFNIK